MVPKITIIIPVYNSENTLRRCLDSVLAQTFTDYECLLIDDGSIDNSGRICDEYAENDKRFRVFHKENGGVSSARNVGLDNAKGEWILFCDADDFVLSGWLNNFRFHSSENIDMVIQGMKTNRPLTNCSEALEYALEFNLPAVDAMKVLSDNNLLGYTFLKSFRRSVLNDYNIRFDARLKFNEDSVFVIDYLSKVRRVVSTNSIGYFYFVPDWSRKYSSRQNFEIYYEKCIDYLERANVVAFNYYVHALTEILIEKFIAKSLDRRNALKLYSIVCRRYICQNNFRISHPIFDKMKWILFFDFALFSSFCLDMVSFCYNFYKRIKL